MAPEMIADSIVSLIAFCGVWVLIGTIKNYDNTDPIRTRFIYCLYVVAILLLARVFSWISDIWAFEIITMIAAGLIPLCVVMLMEGLLRRHAPFWLKAMASGGALLFLLLAFTGKDLLEPYRTWLLLLFQLISFIAIGILVLKRDKESISALENQMVERLTASIILIVPFLITDFRTDLIEIPVRMGGIAILFMCWLTISLGRSQISHQDLIKNFTLLLFSTLVVSVSVYQITGISMTDAVRIFVIVLSILIFTSTYLDATALDIDRRRQTLLNHMAEGSIEDSASFLRGLQNHPLVKEALILAPTDLEDFDTNVLKPLFDRQNVLRKIERNKLQHLSAPEKEQLDWLFEKYGATHAILASQSPFTIVVLNMPAMAASVGSEIELKVVQRIALLISEKNKNQPK